MDAKTTNKNTIIKPFPKQGLSDHVRAAPTPVEPRPSREEAEAAVRTLIAYTGDDPKREGVLETPKRVIGAYDHPVVRAYAWGRFQIFRQRFLDELGQYLPDRGVALDVGCGFGLFALYFAQIHPDLEIHGFDLSEKRIEVRKAAGIAAVRNIVHRHHDTVRCCRPGWISRLAQHCRQPFLHVPASAFRHRQPRQQ